jgi:hypothetical protein
MPPRGLSLFKSTIMHAITDHSMLSCPALPCFLTAAELGGPEEHGWRRREEPRGERFPTVRPIRQSLPQPQLTDWRRCCTSSPCSILNSYICGCRRGMWHELAAVRPARCGRIGSNRRTQSLDGDRARGWLFPFRSGAEPEPGDAKRRTTGDRRKQGFG